MKEQRLLDIWLQAQICLTIREAMIAENKQREICGNSMAFTEEAFDRIIDELTDLLMVLRT